MTDPIPTLPAVGETLSLHGGTITRISDRRFCVVTCTGKTRRSAPIMRLPTVAFRWGENILRRSAGLPELPALCAQCGERPRSGKTNSYCSSACSIEASAAQCSQEVAAEPMPVIMERLHKLVPPAPILPYEPTFKTEVMPTDSVMKCTRWAKEAKTTINRIVLDRVLARARRRHLLQTEVAS